MIRKRLLQLLDEDGEERDPLDVLLSGEDMDDDLIDEILEDEDDATERDLDQDGPDHQIEPEAVRSEIRLVENFINWARSTHTDEKTRALLHALEIGFAQLQEMGAQRRAVVFTESRRTQEYLKRYLEANGYAGKVVAFSGTNRDADATAIYERWLARNEPKGRSSGSRKIDSPAALIEEFRNHAQIMIATEAGAEGINLQFCSLVVNYDLPWNPQRIEQRIGRVHRYGQQFDVVVINFLNTRNYADQRVFELLDEEFRLFQGVFGASDEVLGALESGVDFERRVLEIYQTCRTPAAIEDAFSQLREELDAQIQARMMEVRQTLLERFDQDVHERLRLNLEHARGLVRRTERFFWALTKHVLHDSATFDDTTFSFVLSKSPIAEAPVGRYVLSSQRIGDESPQMIYRLSHPLGQWVIEQAKRIVTNAGSVLFEPARADMKVTMAEHLAGRSGFLTVHRLVILGAETEEYLLVSGVDGENASLNPEAAEKLFAVPGRVIASGSESSVDRTRLDHEVARHAKAVAGRSAERNGERLREEREKLYRWEEDQEKSAEQELDAVKQQIQRVQREARQATTVDEQAQLEEQLRTLDRKKRTLRARIVDIEDQIQARRDELLDKLEARVQQVVEHEKLFTIGWRVE